MSNEPDLRDVNGPSSLETIVEKPHAINLTSRIVGSFLGGVAGSMVYTALVFSDSPSDFLEDHLWGLGAVMATSSLTMVGRDVYFPKKHEEMSLVQSAKLQVKLTPYRAMAMR